jgi:hypothetical protein
MKDKISTTIKLALYDKMNNYEIDVLRTSISVVRGHERYGSTQFY